LRRPKERSKVGVGSIMTALPALSRNFASPKQLAPLVLACLNTVANSVRALRGTKPDDVITTTPTEFEPRPRTRALVVSRGDRPNSPEGHQIHGFRMYRDDLERELGLSVEVTEAKNLGQLKAAVAASAPDIAVLMVSWGEPVEDVLQVLRELQEFPKKPKVVFLDYYAPTSSPHFGVLPYVDRYVKRQVLTDLSEYQRDLRGGFVLTDFLAQHGYDIGTWSFGSKPATEHLSKITSGWNLGVTPLYRSMLRFSRPLWRLWERRPFDVNRRLGLGRKDRKEWYEEYRSRSLSKLEPLSGRFRMTGIERVSRHRYLLEMGMSRVVVSPFGWGELCFRDYEAVACGALLVKPSMDHLVTSPPIYQAGETYVPVAWDLSDLAEKVEYHLRHPAESVAIVRNAQRVLSDYYERGGFVADVKRAFDVRIGEPAGASTRA
jgi:hypothetical protein